ncbi:universal stress protein [Mycolicibacterium duvalii]|uniref:Universal stress protein n=2 Tax=Mycolicibacterium duvalii TaxID=39688 RepID=A0A7I7K4T1_9MYCO|nr:universal stress protein [Mycolicibacterium duvalii]PEG42597.1 universal stress protein [Mycolicibacterium duvalii]BBX18491.1 universal stress protein [Mycolicibacterium duvalii]
MPLPVVAGVDGSAAARRAALWAADEAEARGTSVLLIYAIKPAHLSATEYTAQIRHARDTLREMRIALQANGKAVDVETEIVDGPAAEALVAASERAAMVCVGSAGIDRYARSIVGSTAAEVAERAYCPVALIRPEEHPSSAGPSWIIVAVSDRPDNPAVVEHALREATLRRTPVLFLGDRRDAGSADALERRIRPWRERYPDVHIYPIADRADVAHFLKRHDEPVLLAVIGSEDVDEVAQILGSGHSVLRHGTSSALVVRS